MPEPCRGVSNGPFGSRECAVALAELCEAHTDMVTCRLEPSIPFDPSYVQCGWSQVVTFADPATCSGPSVEGKCYAQFVAPEPDGCVESCGFYVSEAEGSLIDPSCGINGLQLEGLISAATPIGSDEQSVDTCRGSLSDRPALCACVDQACQALQ
jgi:hypothetical protein